jgi:hypothetical protein
MRIDWNVDHVIAQCSKMYRGAVDPHATGFVNWPCKQDLYRVKFALDEMLKHAPTFAGESEWLLDQERLQIWKILKNE